MRANEYMFCVLCEKDLTLEDDIYIVDEGILAHRSCQQARQNEPWYKQLLRYAGILKG